MAPTPGSDGRDGRDNFVMPVPAPATFEHPVELKKAAIFMDTSGQVRTEKDMRVNGCLRVYGNVRVAGSTTVEDYVRVPQFPAVIEPWQPKELVSGGNPRVFNEKLEFDGYSYHFNEGISCTGDDEIVIKGSPFVEGNLSCRELVASGSVSFWGGFSGLVGIQSHLQRASNSDVLHHQ